MKKLLLFAIALTFGLSSFSQIYQDDFESYNVGEYLAVQSDDWDTWSGAPGGSEDALITDEQALSGTQSVIVEGATDLILPMGDKTSGVYEFDINLYVPAGFAGYYNFQHYESPGIEWAFEIYFLEGGSTIINAGGDGVATFNFNHDEWFTMHHVIDLDNDWSEVYYEGTMIHEWQWSLGAQGNGTINQLGGLDVFAGAQTGETPKFYFDDITYAAMASAIYEDDFESYNVGEYLAVQSDDWDTWSGAPGGSEDALITDEQALSGTQSVIVEGATDLILPMGDKTSGVYEFYINLYVPAGFAGYYNFQHYESPGIEWAFEIYFLEGGSTIINAGGDGVATFNYNHDEWFEMYHVIDLDNDWSEVYYEGTMVHEWQWSLGAQGNGTINQLGGLDVFAGAQTGETPKFYFDDILYSGTSTIGDPDINVSATNFIEQLPIGGSTTDMFTIENVGEADLNYEAMVLYPSTGKTATIENTNKQEHVLSVNNSVVADPDYQSANPSAPPTDDVTLNYDGDNFSAVGLTDGGPMRVAAMFPSDMVNPYIGMELYAIEIYNNDMGTSYKAQVYDYGSPWIPGAGELIYEQVFTPPMANWHTINLNETVTIEGGDIWVGYWVDHAGGTFPAGTDEGPADPNGDWISTGPGWSHLSDNPALPYNWNIRAHLTGDAITQWLSINPTSGTLMQDEMDEINMTYDATDLDPGQYDATIVIQSNDPDEDEIQIPVILDVITGIGENETSAVMVYPNPATDVLYINSDVNISKISMINFAGQEVMSNVYNEKKADLNVSALESGIYFIQIETENGISTQKVTLK